MVWFIRELEDLPKMWIPGLMILMFFQCYHLVMTNIAMENPQNKWRFLAAKIIYFYGPFSMAMLNNRMVYQKYGLFNLHLHGLYPMFHKEHKKVLGSDKPHACKPVVPHLQRIVWIATQKKIEK